jgi:hypothetical protein
LATAAGSPYTPALPAGDAIAEDVAAGLADALVAAGDDEPADSLGEPHPATKLMLEIPTQATTTAVRAEIAIRELTVAVIGTVKH